MEPALVGRSAELALLGQAIADGAGAVVAGPAGIGKTRLVAEACEGRQVVWVPTTSEAARIPLGPLIALVPELGTDGGPSGMRSAPAALRRVLSGVGEHRLLVVDDAHHLDEASAAAVHDLVSGGSIRVIATVRAGERVPAAVTALWKDLGLPRIELGPLGRADADELCSSLLGGNADALTLAAFWRMSRGHPLELRELVRSARDAGSLTEAGGVWMLAGSFTPSSRLVELVEERLVRLGDDERAAAEALAYCEPLAVDLLLAVAAADAVERLERAGLLRVVGSPPAATATLAHPLYGEVLRSTLPSVRRQVLAAELVAAVRDAGASVDPLRLATWSLESGRAEPSEMADAAQDAIGRMAWDLAVDFGSASLAQEESHRAHLYVGTALAELGDVEGAERHLRRAGDLAGDSLEAAWSDISLARMWFYQRGRMEDSTELLRDRVAAAEREGDREAWEPLVSALAMNLMMVGRLAEMTAVSSDILARTDTSPPARLMALTATTLTDSLMLRPEQARAGVDAALSLAEAQRSMVPGAEDFLEGVLCTVDIVACDVPAARRRVDERRRAALDGGLAGLPGFWGNVHGLVLLHEGRARASHQAFVEAVMLLERFDSWLLRPVALVEAAHAAAVLGRPDVARLHVGEIPPEIRSSPRGRLRLGIVDALLTATERGVTEGASAAVAAGDRAAESDQLVWAVDAWHLAVRFGRPEPAVDRLARIAAGHPGTVAGLLHDHAVALAGRDPEALRAAAAAFHAAGFGLLAAEVACQLAGVQRRRRKGSLARQAAAWARELLPEGSGARTPPFAELAGTSPLTAREREIALLAAAGLASKEIAGRLSLSPRSVDNHLAKVYLKLGVSGRGELPEILVSAPQPVAG